LYYKTTPMRRHDPHPVWTLFIALLSGWLAIGAIAFASYAAMQNGI
jgi:hypothetical protein